MLEIWRPVPEHPGYKVSDHGRVRSYWARGAGESLNWHIAEQSQRILRPNTDRRGYPYVILKNHGKARTMKIHRLVLTQFIGPCPDGLVCCHNDGTPSNNHIDNLRWDTPSANVQDSIRHGTYRQGNTGRYTPEQIVSIRVARAQGQDIQSLAQEYGCHPQTMKVICLGYTYKDVGGPRISAYVLLYARAEKIRQEWQDGTTQATLANKYNLSSGRISEIVNYKTWRTPPRLWAEYAKYTTEGE